MALAMVLNMLAFLLTASRSMFAWAFDRVMPEIFARVSARTASPIYVAIVAGIGSLIALYFAAYTPYLSFFLNGTIWFAADLLLVAIAGIVYPYRRKDLYENSIWKINIAKVPVVSILSALSAAFLVFLIYAASVTPAIGPTSLGSYAIIFASFAIPLVIYGVAKYYRAREGIDLSLLYMSIPPE